MEFLQMSGSLLLLLSGVAMGSFLNRGAGAVLSQAESFGKLLRAIRREITCFSLPIEEIFSRVDPVVLLGCGWRDENPPRNVSDLLERSAPRDPECARLISAFAAEFGRGYREEQVALLDYYVSLMDARADELRERMTGKKRVNLTLCSAGAAALVVLFL